MTKIKKSIERTRTPIIEATIARNVRALLDAKNAYAIALSKDTKGREYRPLDSIKDNYPKYVATANSPLQQRTGIEHINLVDFMRNRKNF